MPYVRKTTRKGATKKKRVVVVAPKKSYVKKAAPMRTVKKAAASRKSSSGFALGTAIGSALGMALGGPGGGALGGMVGNAGGRFLSSIFGHGDYGVSNLSQIKENNIALSNSAQAPQFGTGRVAVNLRHREFLGDIISSATASAFSIQSFSINPGLPQTFPWLAGVVGASFQQYRINGMTFEFRSMSGDSLTSANTALGSVIMATDYDSADVAFASKQQMENTEYGVSCKPSTNMMHAIECARSQTSVSELYVRAFANPINTDVRLYDLGKFYVASVGCQGTSVNLGELWVTYDIDVFKAIEQVPQYQVPQAVYLTTGATPVLPLGTPTLEFTNSDTIGLAFPSSNKCTFPVGIQVGATYLITLDYVAGSTAAIVAPVLTCGGGMQGSPNIDVEAPPNGTVTGSYVRQWAVQYQGGATLAAPPFINFANFTWATSGIVEGQLIINQTSGNFAPGYSITTA